MFSVTSFLDDMYDGLAEEIRADLFAPNVRGALKTVAEHPVRIPQPDVPQLGGQEAENRFRHMFGEFLHAVATPEHPLVLFIDDLQWIDAASLGLLAAIRSDREGPGLLVVGAYRGNEVDGSHPLAKFIDESDERGMPLRRLELANLERRDVEALLADTLGKRNGVDELGAIVPEPGLLIDGLRQSARPVG